MSRSRCALLGDGDFLAPAFDGFVKAANVVSSVRSFVHFLSKRESLPVQGDQAQPKLLEKILSAGFLFPALLLLPPLLVLLLLLVKVLPLALLLTGTPPGPPAGPPGQAAGPARWCFWPADLGCRGFSAVHLHGQRPVLAQVISTVTFPGFPGSAEAPPGSRRFAGLPSAWGNLLFPPRFRLRGLGGSPTFTGTALTSSNTGVSSSPPWGSAVSPASAPPGEASPPAYTLTSTVRPRFWKPPCLNGPGKLSAKSGPRLPSRRLRPGSPASAASPRTSSRSSAGKRASPPGGRLIARARSGTPRHRLLQRHHRILQHRHRRQDHSLLQLLPFSGPS